MFPVRSYNSKSQKYSLDKNEKDLGTTSKNASISCFYYKFKQKIIMYREGISRTGTGTYRRDYSICKSENRQFLSSETASRKPISGGQDIRVLSEKTHTKQRKLYFNNAFSFFVCSFTKNAYRRKDVRFLKMLFSFVFVCFYDS